MIKFVSDMQLFCPPVSSTNKTDFNDIPEILLKGVLNTIYQTKLRRNYLSLLNFFFQLISELEIRVIVSVHVSSVVDREF